MNDHEGDWEGLYLFFRPDPAGRPQEPPAYITDVGHSSRLTKPWGHRDVTLDGTHPLAHVAGGSHATYPECKPYHLMKIYDLVDHATGDGLTITPSAWRNSVDLDSQPWASAFLGNWGTRYWLAASWVRSVLGQVRATAEEVGLPGVSAPPRMAASAPIGSRRRPGPGSWTWIGVNLIPFSN